MEGPRVQIYIDESIHHSLDFIVSAFVFSKGGLEAAVSDALRDAGLRPGIDEFKSSTFMEGNFGRQKLRDGLLRLAGQRARVALAVSPASARTELGGWCLSALETVVRRNGFLDVAFDAHFDEGIFESRNEAVRLAARCGGLRRVSLHPVEDSKKCLGIQVADVTAHVTAQVIREAITGQRKMVSIGGPETGYGDDEMAPLGWSLKMSLRHGLLRRPIVHRGQSYHPEIDPVVVERGDDYVEIAQHPDVLGWGVQIHDALSANARSTVDRELGKIWLGCIH